jgi:hypothetical protein
VAKKNNGIMVRSHLLTLSVRRATNSRCPTLIIPPAKRH